MKTEAVFIELSSPSRSYFAGQTIQGRVVVQNDKPLKVKEVTVLLEGAGRVYWTESESYTAYETRHVNGRSESHPVTRTRTVVYSATEKYVSHKISLAGDGRNLMELPRGTLVYPFQFVLPANCPSSFTSKIGLVSYFLEAELRRPLLKPNKRTALPFTVNGIFDLNTERGAKQAREIEKVKGSNFCVCRKGQLGFVLKLPRRSGFVSGETLDFTAEVSNGSNKKIKRMKATLYQFTTFHANGKTRTETKAICQVQGPEVDVGEHEMWVPNNLVIPALPPTKLGGLCRIIDIQYCICCELKISGLTMSLSGQLPVLIGTIPLRSTFDELRCNTHTPLQEPSHVSPPGIGFHLPGSSNSNFSPGFSGAATTNKKSPYNAVDSTVPSAPFLAEYPDLPPPTYAEATMSEQFTWTEPVDYLTDHGSDNNGYVADGVPSAPPMGEYVPKYITYKNVQA